MKTIHIAGTNGKGSTATYLASILSRGHKTGLYTSPHIRVFPERFVLDGRRIDTATLDRLLQEERDDDVHLFMVWTRAAKRWLEESGAEYAVIEAGLGGMKDPTLMFDSDFEIITPIALDHTEVLGNTVAEIAAQKAGIIRRGSSVLTSPQQPEALRVIEDAAIHQQADLTILHPEDVVRDHSSLSGQAFSIQRADLQLSDLFIRALSPAQPENAAVAALAAVKLGISEEDIREGLRRTHIQGRVEYIPPNILVDGGHNEQALMELKKAVQLYFSDRGITILFAMMREKNAAAAARILESISNEIYLTCADDRRGFSPQELAKFFTAPVHLEDDPRAAFSQAYAAAKCQDRLLLVCGSFYLVGDVAESIEEMTQQRLASTLW